MMQIRKRCLNCGAIYLYTVSGGRPGLVQSPEYCPECYEAVCEALKAIPPKWKRVWVPIEGITLETLQRWEEESGKASKGTIFPNLRRIGVGLVDMEAGVFQVVRIVAGREGFERRTFQYSYWPGKEDEVEIQEQVAQHVNTGEIAAWEFGAQGWFGGVRNAAGRFPVKSVFEQPGARGFKVGPIEGGALSMYGEDPGGGG